jgi:hypothetical protein
MSDGRLVPLMVSRVEVRVLGGFVAGGLEEGQWGLATVAPPRPQATSGQG